MVRAPVEGPLTSRSKLVVWVKAAYGLFIRLDNFSLKKLNRRTGHDGGNCVLVNKLRVTIPAQENAKIIKPSDNPLQLHAIHKEDRQRDLVLAHMVEELVLQVLVFVICHGIAPTS